MKTFTIEAESNNITAHATKREAAAVPNVDCFTSAAELAELAANWTAPRLVEIWTSIPGNTPVKKFTDRKTAATRIWKAIQSLGDSIPAEAGAEPAQTEPSPDMPPSDEAPVAENEEVQAETPASEPEGNVSGQSPDVAPEEAKATKKATSQKKSPTGDTTPRAPREESKTSQVIAMLKREGGTTLEEIMTAMGWQKHTTRAMLSAGGSLTKKHGLIVTSEKVGEKRVYLINA